MEDNKSKFSIDNKGFYGKFGGTFIPEMLNQNIADLRKTYLDIYDDPAFKEEYSILLRDYVGRPSPLYFANRMSEKYKLDIYLKREDLNHTGSHKINNTIGQILLASRLGKSRIIAETGAGQHGVATATVCALKGVRCVVYMGEEDVRRQARNVSTMKMLGAEVIPVSSGSSTLKDATNEALRDWISNPEDTHYIIGSAVGPHPYPDMVARFQSVISEEIRMQLKIKTGSELPDYVLACVGGGSNAIGAFYHFLDDSEVKLIGAEGGGKGSDTGMTAASLASGSPGVLHGSRSMLLQDENGQIIEPYSISAGLDYPGIGPIHSFLDESGRANYISINDKEALDAAAELIKLEGIIPALESAHAIALLKRKEIMLKGTIVINLSGRGEKDLDTYFNTQLNEQN